MLAFSGEYGTGMIRATLAVVPARLPVLWAKLIVLAGLVLPLSLLAAVGDFFTATALESARGGSAISLTDPGVLREVAGASLYLTVIASSAWPWAPCCARPRLACRCSPRCSSSADRRGLLPHKITGFAPYLPSNAGGALWGSRRTPAPPAEPVDRIRGACAATRSC